MTNSSALLLPTEDSFKLPTSTSLTATHGLESGSNSSATITTSSLPSILERLKAKFVPVESKALQPQEPPSLPSMQPKPMPKMPQDFSARDKQELAMLVGQMAAMQKAYGKQEADVEALVEGYCLYLDRFTLPQIRQAMKDYMVMYEDIPSPANIAQIIDPSLAPLCRATYVALTKKIVAGNPYSITIQERRYIEKYEANELRKTN